MRRPFSALALIPALLMLGTAALAATPGQLNYQGLLLDDLGDPVTANVDLVFTIFDAPSAGSSLWTETHLAVPVLDGVYDVVLGDTTPITPAVVAGGALHLEIEVEGETLTPRQRLVAVPYAVHAAGAASLDGFEGAYFSQIVQNFSFDGGDPPNDDPSEGTADVDGDGLANFIDADNDGDGLDDATELGQGSDINLVTPTISGLSPEPADATTTTTITITGTGFEAGMSVSFGSESPSPQNVTSSSAEVDVGPQPVGIVAVQVTRINGESASDSFEFVQDPPVITSLVPTSQDYQTTAVVTVQGQDFLPGLQVSFGSENPTPQNLTPTSFDVTVGPQAAGGVQVVVSNPSGLQDSALFEFVDSSQPKTVFVSSLAYDGALGGIAGADAACAARASAASLTGTYRAWIGDSTGDPGANFTKGFPYFLVNGTQVASGYADLTDGTLAAAISRDEFDAAAGGSAVWTNVATDGTAQGNHCLDWTTNASGVGGIGTTPSTGSSWTSSGTTSCANTRRLYCFEQ